MNRLIRAEFLRISKTYHLLLWYILLFAVLAVIMIVDAGFDFEGNAAESLPLITANAVSVFMFAPVIIAVMFAFGYASKMLSYEIMAGEKTGKILLSKLIAVVPLLTFVMVLACFIPILYFGVRNGFGDGKMVAEKLALIAVIFLRVVCSSVLIMMIFKSFIGVAFVYVRFLVDAFYLLGLQVADLNVSEKTMEKLSLCGSLSSFSLLGTTETDGGVVAVIVGSCVVEILIWYVLSYISYERKWFN